MSTSVTLSRPRWNRTSSPFMWLSPGEKQMRPNQLFLLWCIWSCLTRFNESFLCYYLQERKGWSPTNHCTKIVKFSIKYFFSKCDQILRKLQKTLVTFTEEILNGKLHFLSSELLLIWCIWSMLIWVSIKILTPLFWFLQNWSARFCFKGSLMLPKLAWSHWKFRE